MDAAALDTLPFGVIGLDAAGLVDVYSAVEARYAGLKPETVMGRHFFTAVAPCMNNALVAGRFDGEPELDVVIDYVLTFRMRPTRVAVRLIQNPDVPRRYILIQR
ncbi:PAS domain-containing protein [Salinarimonas soli]|uniref:PAS domain-containing protein n=2 Tax=Salinarimonas soli TaxID=1638099 RepID=A0A5B2VGT4_9HYPH|nr:PAS domain-containing protein [Salinarimonas soli]